MINEHSSRVDCWRRSEKLRDEFSVLQKTKLSLRDGVAGRKSMWKSWISWSVASWESEKRVESGTRESETRRKNRFIVFALVSLCSVNAICTTWFRLRSLTARGKESTTKSINTNNRRLNGEAVQGKMLLSGNRIKRFSRLDIVRRESSLRFPLALGQCEDFFRENRFGESPRAGEEGKLFHGKISTALTHKLIINLRRQGKRSLKQKHFMMWIFNAKCAWNAESFNAFFFVLTRARHFFHENHGICTRQGVAGTRWELYDIWKLNKAEHTARSSRKSNNAVLEKFPHLPPTPWILESKRKRNRKVNQKFRR